MHMMNSDLEHITERELEILRLISEGSSDREISQKLYLSINTVKWHNRQIYAKLGVSSRTEAVCQGCEVRPAGQMSHLQMIGQAPVIPNNLPAPVLLFCGSGERGYRSPRNNQK